MKEKYQLRPHETGVEISKIDALKRELYVRKVPDEYESVIREAKFMGGQLFSQKLENAIAKRDLLSKKYGRFVDDQLPISPEQVQDDNLTEFGTVLKEAMQGRDFFDLGSSTPASSLLPRYVAEAFGSSRYIGVDIDLKQEEESTLGEMPVAYLNGDILSFLSQIELQHGSVFFISGIESTERLQSKFVEKFRNGNEFERKRVKQYEINLEYINSCLKELSRVTKKGDVVVLGMGTHDFHPEKYGFRLTSKIEKEGFMMFGLFVRE